MGEAYTLRQWAVHSINATRKSHILGGSECKIQQFRYFSIFVYTLHYSAHNIQRAIVTCLYWLHVMHNGVLNSTQKNAKLSIVTPDCPNELGREHLNTTQFNISNNAWAKHNRNRETTCGAAARYGILCFRAFSYLIKEMYEMMTACISLVECMSFGKTKTRTPDMVQKLPS